MKNLLPMTLAALATIDVAPAQFVDGELIIDTYLPATGSSLLRVDPATGTSQILISGYYRAGWAGGLVYDSYRDGLLFSTSLPPDPYWLGKLWFVDADGTAAAIPGFHNVALRAMCSVGDGRVYYQEHSPVSDEIRFLDGANAIHTLLDATGTSPFSFAVEHLLYHAPSNSLLATTSGGWSSNHCAPSSCSIFRIPLSANGDRVLGAPVCSSIATANENIMSMDYLPDGSVLLNLASGTAPIYPDLLLRVDPVTLAATPYASPSVGDLDGACFSPAIGRAVVLDDISNVLRAYAPGSSGSGQVIATNHAVSPNTTGYSPRESMWRVDRNGPGCSGSAIPYGTGLAGTGGITPSLGVAGCPEVGSSFTIAASQLRGGTIGVIGFGSPAAIPALGGTLLIFPVNVSVTLVASGNPSQPGTGTAGLPLLVNQPSAIGASLWMQAAFLDPAAPFGFSLSNGLQIVFG